jgi:hypothetical protein
MATNWHRVSNSSADWTGTWWIVAMPAGATLLRTRFSWGFTVTADPLVADTSNMQFNTQIFGLVTTIGNGTEAVPDARLASGDAAPPTQRWIWWEHRAPVISAYSAAGGVVAWRDSGSQEIIDSRSQVLATGIPGGDTLNLWASWSGGYGLGSNTEANVWAFASVLYKT